MAADVMTYVTGTGIKNNRITVFVPNVPLHKDSGDDKAASDTYNFNILKDRLDDPTYYG